MVHTVSSLMTLNKEEMVGRPVLDDVRKNITESKSDFSKVEADI